MGTIYFSKQLVKPNVNEKQLLLKVCFLRDGRPWGIRICLEFMQINIVTQYQYVCSFDMLL